MISALIINLDSSVERWKFQKEQCEGLGLVYERISACDQKDIPQDEFHLLQKKWQRALSASEVACFKSHYLAWQRVIAEKKPFLILEDDAFLVGGILDILHSLVQKKYVYINMETVGRRLLLARTRDFVNADYDSKNVFLAKNGAGAYVLWPEGAEQLLAYYKEKGIALVDAFIVACFRPDNLRQIWPAASIQFEFCQQHGLPSEQLVNIKKTTIQYGRSKKKKTLAQHWRRLLSNFQRIGVWRYFFYSRYQSVPFAYQEEDKKRFYEQLEKTIFNKDSSS
jgi:glycosyl transferase family 25